MAVNMWITWILIPNVLGGIVVFSGLPAEVVSAPPSLGWGRFVLKIPPPAK